MAKRKHIHSKKNTSSRRKTAYVALKGKSPGTLLNSLESDAPVRLDCFRYNQQDLEALSNLESDYLQVPNDPLHRYWFNLDGTHQTKLIKKLGEIFTIHPLILEDIVHLNQRPKAEMVEGRLFVSVKMLKINAENEVEDEQVGFVMGEGFLISFQEKTGDVFDPVRERLLDSTLRIRRRDVDYLLYALIDVIVDNYFIVAEHLNEEVEQLEERILENKSDDALSDIQSNRRKLLALKKAIFPLRETLIQLEKEEQVIKEENRKYFRDVYDHVMQLRELIESMRDMNTGVRDLYTNIQNNKMNVVMQRLTVMASIFIPLTFLAGIYGMNFEHMPELGYTYAYFTFLIVCALIVILQIWYFKKKKWM